MFLLERFYELIHRFYLSFIGERGPVVLVEGGYYKLRNGQVIGPLEHVGLGEGMPWKWWCEGHFWMDGGFYFSPLTRGRRDIVSRIDPVPSISRDPIFSTVLTYRKFGRAKDTAMYFFSSTSGDLDVYYGDEKVFTIKADGVLKIHSLDNSKLANKSRSFKTSDSPTGQRSITVTTPD